ncbi:MAG: hypothetical protein R3C03_13050 [Pirellulaceae bacterium]
MSLFENGEYQYRDTFFVLFHKTQRPDVARIKKSLEGLGGRYDVVNVQVDDNGQFESITVKSPYDFSAMDIVYVEGDEVEQQVKDLIEEFRSITLIGDEASKLKLLKGCNARFDVFHFEHIDSALAGEEDLDPGGLLLVMEKLSDMSEGIGLDPQSMSLL